LHRKSIIAVNYARDQLSTWN